MQIVFSYLEYLPLYWETLSTYHTGPKYWETLSTYHTGPTVFTVSIGTPYLHCTYHTDPTVFTSIYSTIS